MILKISLVLFFLVCVPCHTSGALWDLLSPVTKISDSTIPPVTKPESSSQSFGTDNPKGVSDFRLFFDEPGSSSPNRSDKPMKTDSDSTSSSTPLELDFDDSGVGMNDGKSSSQAPGGNRRATDESDSTTVEDDLSQNGTHVPVERDSETTAPTETTVTTDAITSSSTSSESKIMRMITSTSTQPSTSEATTFETTISSSSTTEEPSTSTEPTATTEPITTEKIENSTEIESSTSIKPNKRSCDGLDCDEDAASEASETLNKSVTPESSSSSSASSTPFSSSKTLNENTTLDNSTGQPAVDAARSATEVKNITVIAEPAKNGNSARDVEDSIHKTSSTTKKPSTPSINPNKRPMSSSGLIVAPADKVSFLIVCITFFLSLKVTGNTF